MSTADERDNTREPRHSSEAGGAAALAHLVCPEDLKVWENPFRKLCISVQGEEHSNVRARRAFPLSDKAEYVGFIDKDSQEVALLAEPRRLDKESRRALEDALERAYCVAKILRVFEVRFVKIPYKWRVETDRGYVEFKVSNRHRQLRKMTDGGMVITDDEGNRYEIDDIASLDPESYEHVITWL